MDKQYKKRIKRTRRRTEGENTPRLTQSNTKNKNQTGKHQDVIAYIDGTKNHAHP